MENLDAALNNMSHGLCMFGPDNRLLLWNDRYVKMYRLAPDRLHVGSCRPARESRRHPLNRANRLRCTGAFGPANATGSVHHFFF
ncbi:PAS-domain containing protein [Bradyrhizobium algeriense]|uniref:PAS-domain containing protein n=1 Tax=Bradyrhizobium algeriense TaxID=634784 RepID=UPI000D340724|nr:PAS-domain containing protein [Bradyrhizobium algeriense]